MHIENDIKLDFCDVLIKPKRSTLSSRSVVSLERTFKFPHSDIKLTCVPIMSANMDTTGTFEMFAELKQYKMITVLHKHYSAQELIEFYNNISEEDSNYVFYSLGIGQWDKDKYDEVKARVNKKIKFVCIDAPSAYIEKFVDFLVNFRKENTNIVIMAGNVCSGEMTAALVLAGADIIKAGIGGGGVCLTRRVAGVGVPQLSCLIDCSEAAHGLSGLVCGDGGIVHPGDLGKCFGTNADFAMMGSVLAGHKESGGDLVVLKSYSPNNYIASADLLTKGATITKPDITAALEYVPQNLHKEHFGKKFYGMSSYEAQSKHYGEIKDYRASEGREVVLPYKGSVHETLKEYLGGLRSTLTYTGSKNLKELSKRTTFILVNRNLNTSLGN